jgi:hypothetical protein
LWSGFLKPSSESSPPNGDHRTRFVSRAPLTEPSASFPASSRLSSTSPKQAQALCSLFFGIEQYRPANRNARRACCLIAARPYRAISVTESICTPAWSREKPMPDSLIANSAERNPPTLWPPFPDDATPMKIAVEACKEERKRLRILAVDLSEIILINLTGKK